MQASEGKRLGLEGMSEQVNQFLVAPFVRMQLPRQTVKR